MGLSEILGDTSFPYYNLCEGNLSTTKGTNVQVDILCLRRIFLALNFPFFFALRPVQENLFQ